jgi:hypothetical protein
MKRFRAPLAAAIAMLVAACSGPTVARRADVPRGGAHATTPRVETCPASSPAVTVVASVERAVAEVAGVRYALGTRDRRPGLVWLAADGALGLTEAPLHFDLCVPEGASSVRCFRSPVRELDGSLTPLRTARADVTGAPGPAFHAMERWAGAPWAALVAAASDGRRAALVSQELESGRQHLARVWDVATGRPLGKTLSLEAELEPLRALCGAVGCFLVAAEATRSPRRLVMIRLDDGRREVITGDARHVVAANLGEGGAIVLVWTHGDEDVVASAVVGSDGALAAGPADWSLRLPIRGRLESLDVTGTLAVRTDTWTLARLGDDGRPASLGQTDSRDVGVQAGRVGDGTVLVALTGDTHYTGGDGGDGIAFHFWQFAARATFVSDRGTGTTASWADIVSDAGDGRGGYDVFVLTRPERAALLLWPTGDANGPTRLIPAREPCRPGAT